MVNDDTEPAPDIAMLRQLVDVGNETLLRQHEIYNERTSETRNVIGIIGIVAALMSVFSRVTSPPPIAENVMKIGIIVLSLFIGFVTYVLTIVISGPVFIGGLSRYSVDMVIEERMTEQEFLWWYAEGQKEWMSRNQKSIARRAKIFLVFSAGTYLFLVVGILLLVTTLYLTI